MSTELSTAYVTTTAQGTALTISPEQTGFTDEQASVLRHMGVSGNATPADAALFFHVATRSGLDPFARQIYMIERQGKQTIQTGIDGFRLIGHRAARAVGERVSMAAPQWAHEDGTWRDLWSEKWGVPLAARVTLTRGGEPFTAVAMYDEYVGRKRDGGLTAMWATRPAGMLAKCAEALVWRMAFPQDLSGLYTEDELHAADAPAPARRESVTDVLHSAGAVDLPGEPPADPVGGEPVSTIYTPPPITTAQMKALHASFNEFGVTDRDDRLEYTTQVVGRIIATSNELTKAEASQVLARLETDIAALSVTEPKPQDGAS